VVEAVVEAIDIGSFVEEQVDLIVMTEDIAKGLLDTQT